MLAALQFQTPDRRPLEQLSESGWKKALAFGDRTMLTLPLALSGRGEMPAWVRDRLDCNLQHNADRWTLLQSTYREIAEAFQKGGLEHVVLKGFSHCPLFVDHPRRRPQFDLDLFVPGEQLGEAAAIAGKLGYEPLDEPGRAPVFHVPAMVRKTGWEWREGDDPFGVEIPIALELHFQFWQPEAELFDAPGTERFWERRQCRCIEDMRFPSLHPADQVANASLHLLRHLLHGNLRPSHVYEMAWMLAHSASDPAFWDAWPHMHPAELRRIQAICFAVARAWFDCPMAQEAQEEIDALPAEIRRWIGQYGLSPLAAMFHPNKDELWLYWNLVESRQARFAAVRRRLLPALPAPVSGLHTPPAQLTAGARWRNRWRYAAYLASRLRHHAAATPATAWSAAGWFAGGIGLGAQYWRFFFAEAFFDFGMFVFVLLYNLYLLQVGYGEAFIGQMTGLMMAGNIAGSLLAAYAMQRFGIRRTLIAAFILTGAFCALRAWTVWEPALLALAAATGIAASAWPVAFSPGVAQLTNDKNRRVGFSLICSAGIAIGVLGGLAAGRLPGWLLHAHAASTELMSYRAALLAGCGIIWLALWPFSRVKFRPAPAENRTIHRPSPWLLHFLIAMLAWNLGTGVMNPFFNVFFSRQIHLPVEQIGVIFSAAQVAQVGAVLLAPLVFRRFGLIRGISGMQLATALALLSLAAAAGPLWAAAGYAAYMMTQYMSEPGMFTLLMEGVRPAERGGASALNFLVLFSMQAIAAALAGKMLERFGYPVMLVAAGAICAAAAVMFRFLLRPQTHTGYGLAERG